MSDAPLTLEARELRLDAAGATIEHESGGFGVGYGSDFPEVRYACRVTLKDGRAFKAGGDTREEAMARAFAQAEAALGV